MTRRQFGLISDTHGVVHEAVPPLLEGVEAILHGGDVVGKHVLSDLEAIAPVYAVAGNCDPEDELLPKQRVVELPFGKVGIAHGHLFSAKKETRLKELVHTFENDGVRLILTGHSHIPLLDYQKNIYIINPGAASRPRFSLEPGLCILSWEPETDLLSFDFRFFAW